MLNYLRAECYRIFRKKGLYFYFATLLVLYLLVLFIQWNSLSSDVILMQAGFVFPFLTILGGSSMFAVIYTDDLKATSLPVVIGFGLPRTTIVIVKYILALLLTTLMFAFAFLVLNGFFMLRGFDVIQYWPQIFRLMGQTLFALWVYIGLGSIVVYGTQKATLSLSVFILFVTNIIDTLFNLMFAAFKFDFTPYMIINIVDEMIRNISLSKVMIYVVYLVVVLGVTIVAFRQKDLEF